MRHRQPLRAEHGCRNRKVGFAEGAVPGFLLENPNTRKPKDISAPASSPGTNFTSPKIVPSQHKPHERQMGSEAVVLDFFEVLNASRVDHRRPASQCDTPTG